MKLLLTVLTVSIISVVAGCSSNKIVISDHFNKDIYDSVIVSASVGELSEIDAGRIFKKLGYRVLGKRERHLGNRTLRCFITTFYYSTTWNAKYEVSVTDDKRAIVVVDCEVEFQSLFNPGSEGFSNRIYEKLKPILDISHK